MHGLRSELKKRVKDSIESILESEFALCEHRSAPDVITAPYATRGLKTIRNHGLKSEFVTSSARNYALVVLVNGRPRVGDLQFAAGLPGNFLPGRTKI